MSKQCDLFSHRAFHRFGQAEISFGGLVLSPKLFSILRQKPQKITLALKVVTIDSKIINLLC